jgi:hypothetical protein
MIPWADWLYLLVIVEFWRAAGTESVDKTIVLLETFEMVSEEKIPAWTGTSPHVTRTTAVLAQNTAQ